MLDAAALGTRLFILDDDALVFDPRGQNLYRLDRAAALIWCCLAEGLGRAGAAARLAEASALAISQAERLVDEALATWSVCGLIGAADSGGTRERRRARVSRRQLRRTRPSLSFNIAGLDVHLRGTAPWCMRRLAPIFAHLPPARGVGPRAQIEIEPRPPGARIIDDGVGVADVKCAAGLAPAVKAHLAQRVLAQDDYRLAVHAAALARGGRVVLVPGEAGAGKSTLAAALMARGFDLLGDDTVVLERDLLVRPLPFAPAIKQGAWDLLAPYHPALPSLPIDIRSDGKAVRYLRPRVIAREKLPAAWLVFPDWRKASARATRLPRSEALRRLLCCCYAPAGALGRDDVARLIAWIGAIDCHALGTGDLPAALDAIELICR